MASNEYGIGSLRVTPSKAPEAKNKNLPRNHAENLAVAWALTAHQCHTMAERVASILFVLAPIEGSITVRWFDSHPADGLRQAVSELRARKINDLAQIVEDYLHGKEPSDEVKAALAEIERLAEVDPWWRRFRRLQAKGLRWVRCMPVDEGLG